MYDTEIRGWLKHWDFFVLDILCSQGAFFLSSLIILQLRNYSYHDIYRNEAILILFGLVLQAAFLSPYTGILRRTPMQETVSVFQSTVYLMVINLGLLFFLHIINDMSRKVFVLTWALYAVFTILSRTLMKRFLLHRVAGFKDARAFVIITDRASLDDVSDELSGDIFRNLFIQGAFLSDPENTEAGKTIVPVLGRAEEACEYICKNWVDDVFLYLPGNEPLQSCLMRRLLEMGIPVHLATAKCDRFETGEDHQVEMLGTYVVLTYAIRVVSFGERLVKRVMDVALGLVGCAITGILFLVIGPVICHASPGPVFFSQTRIGRNGKPFRMYKFRSMVPEAEARRKELEQENEVRDGYTFKMTEDPRIIGSGKVDRKGRPRGIGYFIRRTSLDEFPQFFNVLKGDMSIVGTRPPLPDEWEKYQFHHRARMGIRPGITGLWQIRGRNEIDDFEEIVKLDAEYIRTWSIRLDLKIIFLTVLKILQADGK